MDASAVIARVRDLPSLPQLVMELQQSMQREDVDIHALASRITLDAALTAKTLRLANSSFYGVPNKVTTMQQALSVLGLRSIRTLLTACSITGSFSPAQVGAFDLAAFWRHAIATAVCARVLAPHAGINGENAFTAGLLHDIGALVLASQFPAEYRQVTAYRHAHDCQAMVAETAVLGIDHAQVGCALAAHWRFPAAIQEAVAGHHQQMAEGAPFTLTELICLANVLARALDVAGLADEQVPPLALPLWQAIALDEQGWEQVFDEVEVMFADLCQMLTP